MRSHPHGTKCSYDAATSYRENLSTKFCMYIAHRQPSAVYTPEGEIVYNMRWMNEIDKSDLLPYQTNGLEAKTKGVFGARGVRVGRSCHSIWHPDER